MQYYNHFFLRICVLQGQLIAVLQQHSMIHNNVFLFNSLTSHPSIFFSISSQPQLRYLLPHLNFSNQPTSWNKQPEANMQPEANKQTSKAGRQAHNTLIIKLIIVIIINTINFTPTPPPSSSCLFVCRLSGRC